MVLYYHTKFEVLQPTSFENRVYKPDYGTRKSKKVKKKKNQMRGINKISVFACRFSDTFVKMQIFWFQ